MRKLPWGIIFLVIWGLFLTTSVTLYLKFLQPAKLGHTVSSIIATNLKLSPQIDFIKLQFFPNPAIIMNNASLSDKNQNIKIKFDTAQANLSWKTLLAARPVIASIDILNPVVEIISLKKLPQKKLDELQLTELIKKDNIDIPTKEKQLEQKIQTILNKLNQVEIPYFFANASLHLRHGSVKINLSHANDFVNINDINLDLRLPGLINGLLDLRVGEIKLVAQKAPEVQLNQISLLITDWRLDTRNIKANMHLQSQFQMGSLQKLRVKPIKKAYQYFPMPEPAILSIRHELDYNKETQTMIASGLLQAKLVLPMNAHNTPVTVDIPFSLKGTSKNNEKSFLKIPPKTKKNETYLNSFLKNNTFPKKAVELPSFYIDVININDAYIAIGSDSASITGELLGIYPPSPFFQGQAKLHNFSLPRWVGSARKMSGGLVNALNKISGDLDFVVNKQGVFSPYLLGKVNGILVEGLGSCGHFKKPDIALKLQPSLKNLKNTTIDLNSFFPEINGVKIKKVQLPPPALPAQDKKNKAPSIFVDYHIDIAIQEADIWKLSAKNIYTMISPNKNETPTINVSIHNLYQGSAQAFAVLQDGNNYIKAVAQNIDLEEPVRRIAGFTAVRGVLDTTTEIRLSGNSIEKILSSLQVKTSGKITNGSFHSMESLIHEFKNTTYDIDIKTIPFYLKNIQLPSYFQMKGDYNISIEDNSLQSNIKTNALLDFSSKNGLPLRMHPQTSEIKYYASGKSKLDRFFVNGKGLLGYDFTKNEYLNIKDFNGTFNGNIVHGSYNIQKKDQVDWSGKIHFDKINLDEYLFDDDSTPAKLDKETVSFLPIHFLANNSMNYVISATEATLLDTTIRNLNSEIIVNDSKIILRKTKGTVEGGGNIQAFLEAKVTDNTQAERGNIQTQMKFQLDNADMLAITKMRKHDTLVAGNALIQLTVNGIFQTTADILRKLNGTWNVNIQNGYIQDAKPKKSTQEKENGTSHNAIVTSPQTKSINTSKTHFNNLLSSGIITNGLASTQKFVISSPTLSIVGKGKVDIVSKQVDADMLVTYRGISEVPITITGTIDDSVTTVHLLNAVTGTLGNITTGFFGILGGILSAPIDLFTQEKTLSTP